MFHPLSVYVGLRYVRARSHKFFVSFITWASLLGVCVGVAALIVILSVMNGFESELRERLLSLNAPVRDQRARGASRARTGMRRSAPSRARAACAMRRRYAELQALAVRQPEMVPVLLRGIDPAAGDPGGPRALAHPGAPRGSDARLRARDPRGSIIAERLGLSAGDPITVLLPTVSAGGAPTPKLREFTVAGIFEVGLQDHDGTLVFAHLEDVRALGGRLGGRGAAGARSDVLAAPAVAARLRRGCRRGSR